MFKSGQLQGAQGTNSIFVANIIMGFRQLDIYRRETSSVRPEFCTTRRHLVPQQPDRDTGHPRVPAARGMIGADGGGG